MADILRPAFNSGWGSFLVPSFLVSEVIFFSFEPAIPPNCFCFLTSSFCWSSVLRNLNFSSSAFSSLIVFMFDTFCFHRFRSSLPHIPTLEVFFLIIFGFFFSPICIWTFVWMMFFVIGFILQYQITSTLFLFLLTRIGLLCTSGFRLQNRTCWLCNKSFFRPLIHSLLLLLFIYNHFL